MEKEKKTFKLSKCAKAILERDVPVSYLYEHYQQLIKEPEDVQEKMKEEIAEDVLKRFPPRNLENFHWD